MTDICAPRPTQPSIFYRFFRSAKATAPTAPDRADVRRAAARDLAGFSPHLLRDIGLIDT